MTSLIADLHRMDGVADAKQTLALAALRRAPSRCPRLASLAAVLTDGLDPCDPVDAGLIAALHAWREGDVA